MIFKYKSFMLQFFLAFHLYSFFSFYPCFSRYVCLNLSLLSTYFVSLLFYVLGCKAHLHELLIRWKDSSRQPTSGRRSNSPRSRSRRTGSPSTTLERNLLSGTAIVTLQNGFLLRPCAPAE